MKKLGAVLLGLAVALPVYAQDTAPAPSDSSTPPADQGTPPSDSSTPSADQSATPPADQSATPTDTSSTPPPDQSAMPADTSASTPPADQTTTDTSTAPADASATPSDASATPADASATPSDASAAPADASTPTDTSAAPTDAAPTEATVDASSSSESAPAEESKPWILYGGASYGMTKVSISNLSGLAQTDTHTYTVQGRIGLRLTDGLGIEGHFGKGLKDDNHPNDSLMDTYYGIYFVPTGILLDAVEFAFPLGFAWTRIEGVSVGAGSDAPPAGTHVTTTVDGVSYGMNVELPIKLIVEAMPDIRLVGGGMVYQQNNSARTYGWHAGLRWDFAI